MQSIEGGGERWLAGFLHRVQSAIRDRRMGTDTGGTVAPSLPGAYSYATLSYSEIDAILDALALQPGDVFVDIGCGKGRVLCCAAQRKLKAVEGIEIKPAIAELARRNAQKAGWHAPIAVHAMAAQDYSYAAATVMFLFNPFTNEILDQVLDQIERTRANRHPFRLVYVFPKHSDVLSRRRWLTLDAASPVSAVGCSHVIEVWRAADGVAAHDTSDAAAA